MSGFQILLVEDSDTDRKLFSLALTEESVSIQYATDGEKALQLVQSEIDNHNSAPQLIVLDLNIPIRNGFEVISELKSDPKYQAIPIVVFSTSTNESDFKKCYQLGANAFITKPFDLDQYLDTVKKMVQHWEVKKASHYCSPLSSF